MAQEERVHMGLSVKAMIFHAGRLLVLQKNDPEGLHHWEFPGGGLRRDEDFAMAVHREVMEETGLFRFWLRQEPGAIRKETDSF